MLVLGRGQLHDLVGDFMMMRRTSLAEHALKFRNDAVVVAFTSAGGWPSVLDLRVWTLFSKNFRNASAVCAE